MRLEHNKSPDMPFTLSISSGKDVSIHWFDLEQSEAKERYGEDV